MEAGAAVKAEALPPCLSLLPQGVVGAVQRMGIAEEEIAAAQSRHPEKADSLRGAFMSLVPPVSMRGPVCPDVYRAHVRELLERVAAGRPTGPITDAEVLLALSWGSLRAPLERDHAALMGKLFAQVMGDESTDVGGCATESYPGAANELLARLRRKKIYTVIAELSR